MKKRTNTNPMRRLLSLALSIVMVLSLLPAGALAEEPVLDEPVQEELVQEQPVQEEPAQEEPVQEEPEKEEPVQEEPVEQEPEQKQESEQEPVVKTEPAEEEAQSASTDAVITDWEWDDGYEIVDVESGYVILPFTSEEFASSLDDVKGMLPEAILVGEEALTLGNWTYETGEEGAVVTIDSESCPSPGIFKITLPEGYVLADGTNVLSLTVALSAGSSEDTSSYADSDTLAARNSVLRIFPLMVFGISETNSIRRTHLYSASRALQKSLISFSSSGEGWRLPSTMKALIACPRSVSGTPTTLHSTAAGCSISTFSTS